MGFNYFKSDSVRVFPSTYRNAEYDPGASLAAEYNLVRLGASGTLRKDKCCILGYTASTRQLSCVLGGYLFNIVLPSELATVSDLYLYCRTANIAGEGTDNIYTSLVALEGDNTSLDRESGDTSYFYGLGYTTSDSTATSASYKLQVFVDGTLNKYACTDILYASDTDPAVVVSGNLKVDNDLSVGGDLHIDEDKRLQFNQNEYLDHEYYTGTSAVAATISRPPELRAQDNGSITVTVGGKTSGTLTVPYATTASSLRDAPSISIDADDADKIVVTAGGKTSDAFTVPFAEQAETVNLPINRASGAGAIVTNNTTNNSATGDYSTASGIGTVAENIGQTSVGVYNSTSTVVTDAKFVVGIGANDSSRKNGFEVGEDGIYTPGQATIARDLVVDGMSRLNGAYTTGTRRYYANASTNSVPIPSANVGRFCVVHGWANGNSGRDNIVPGGESMSLVYVPPIEAVKTAAGGLLNIGTLVGASRSGTDSKIFLQYYSAEVGEHEEYYAIHINDPSSTHTTLSAVSIFTNTVEFGQVGYTVTFSNAAEISSIYYIAKLHDGTIMAPVSIVSETYANDVDGVRIRNSSASGILVSIAASGFSEYVAPGKDSNFLKISSDTRIDITQQSGFYLRHSADPEEFREVWFFNSSPYITWAAFAADNTSFGYEQLDDGEQYLVYITQGAGGAEFKHLVYSDNGLDLISYTRSVPTDGAEYIYY